MEPRPYKLYIRQLCVGDDAHIVPLRFAMSDTAGGDCVQMAAVLKGGQAKMAPGHPVNPGGLRTAPTRHNSKTIVLSF